MIGAMSSATEGVPGGDRARAMGTARRVLRAYLVTLRVLGSYMWLRTRARYRTSSAALR